jgi:hypothetical protein
MQDAITYPQIERIDPSPQKKEAILDMLGELQNHHDQSKMFNKTSSGVVFIVKLE